MNGTKSNIIRTTISASSISIALLALIWLTLARGASAQGSVGLAISPPTFELTANAGDIVKNTIRVTNMSDSPLSVGTDTRNFTAVGEEGAVGLTEEDISFSLANWIAVEPQEAVIGPNEDFIFTFTTSVPPNAEPGGHFGSVVFKMGGATPGQTGASIRQEIASLVLLRVAGTVKEEAQLLSFNSPKSFYEYGPVDFEIRMKNTGNVHVKPQGTVTITDIFGRQVDQFQIEPKNILPDASRKIDAQWNNRALFGRYTATAVLAYTKDGQPIIATTTFSGIPYRTVALVLIALSIIFALLFRARRRLSMASKVLFGKYDA
jgi:hypothetical protein